MSSEYACRHLVRIPSGAPAVLPTRTSSQWSGRNTHVVFLGRVLSESARAVRVTSGGSFETNKWIKLFNALLPKRDKRCPVFLRSKGVQKTGTGVDQRVTSAKSKEVDFGGEVAASGAQACSGAACGTCRQPAAVAPDPRAAWLTGPSEAGCPPQSPLSSACCSGARCVVPTDRLHL